MKKLNFENQTFICKNHQLTIESHEGVVKTIDFERVIPERTQELIDHQILQNLDELPSHEWPSATCNAILKNDSIIVMESWEGENYLRIYDLRGQLQKSIWLDDMVGHGDISFEIFGVTQSAAEEIAFYGRILDVPLVFYVNLKEDEVEYSYSTEIGTEGKVIVEMKEIAGGLHYLTMGAEQIEFGTFLKYSSSNFSRQQKFFYQFKDFNELDPLFRNVDRGDYTSGILSEDAFFIRSSKGEKSFELAFEKGCLKKSF